MNQAQQGKKLQNQVDDATQKVGLLHGEVVFNQNLVTTLEKLRHLRQVLELGHNAVQSGNFGEAVEFLLAAEHELSSLPTSQLTKVTGILLAACTTVRHDLVEELKKCWKAFFRADFTTASFSVEYRIQRRQLVAIGKTQLIIRKALL